MKYLVNDLSKVHASCHIMRPKQLEIYQEAINGIGNYFSLPFKCKECCLTVAHGPGGLYFCIISICLLNYLLSIRNILLLIWNSSLNDSRSLSSMLIILNATFVVPAYKISGYVYRV